VTDADTPQLPDQVLAILAQSFLAEVPREQAIGALQGGYRSEHEPGRAVTPVQEQPVLAIVIDGLLRVYLASGSGRQVTVRYARPGDALGLVHLFGKRTEVQVQALSRAVLWIVPGEGFRGLCDRSALLSAAVARECAARAVDAMDELALVSFGAVRARLARHLLDLAAVRQQSEALVAAVTQQQLADAVGSVREVVTRVLQGLRADGLIGGGEGGVTILDVSRLDAVATERERSRG
jgi:CRP/FNR family transcriptional regulator